MTEPNDPTPAPEPPESQLFTGRFRSRPMTPEELEAQRKLYESFNARINEVWSGKASVEALRKLGQLAESSNTHLKDSLASSVEYAKVKRPPTGDELLRDEVRRLGAIMTASSEHIELTTAAIGQLVKVTEDGHRQSKSANRWLLIATFVLIVLTAVLIGETNALVNGDSTATVPAPTMLATPSPT